VPGAYFGRSDKWRVPCDDSGGVGGPDGSSRTDEAAVDTPEIYAISAGRPFRKLQIVARAWMTLQVAVDVIRDLGAICTRWRLLKAETDFVRRSRLLIAKPVARGAQLLPSRVIGRQ
jgi:hypothetical protein